MASRRHRSHITAKPHLTAFAARSPARPRRFAWRRTLASFPVVPRRLRELILLSLVTVSSCSLPQNFIRGSNELPEFTNDEGTWRDVDVTMRDGVKLKTHIMMPRGVERAPVVMMRNPYPRDLLFTFNCSVLVRYGLGCVIQDARGQRESEGEWTPLIHEPHDSEDALAWLDAQPWVESIALYGQSYLGGTALAAGAKLTPKVKTLVVVVFGTDLRPVISERGLFPHELLTAWAAYMPGRERPEDPIGSFDKALKTRPHYDVDFGGKADWYHLWLEGVLPHDGLWELPETKEFLAVPPKIQVPVLYIEGFDDPFLEAGLSTFSRLGSRDRSLLALLPVTHIGGQPGELQVKDAEGQYLWKLPVPWLLHHLKGAPLPYPSTGVLTWARNDVKPSHRESWPPPTRNEVRVLQAKPAKESPCTQYELGGVEGTTSLLSYRYNPDHPWMTEGGSRSLGMRIVGLPGKVDPGPQRQTWDCNRRDVVRFTTEPLSSDARLAGRMQLNLTVRSSAKDTAFYAKLVDIDENGKAVHLTDGAATLRLPTAKDETYVPYEPHSVRTVEIDFVPTEWNVPAGHRIGLWVSSSNYPALSAHTNTEEPWFKATLPRLAEQTLELGGPSKLVLKLSDPGR